MQKDLQRFVFALIVGSLVIIPGCQNKKAKMAINSAPNDTTEQLQSKSPSTSQDAQEIEISEDTGRIDADKADKDGTDREEASKVVRPRAEPYKDIREYD